MVPGERPGHWNIETRLSYGRPSQGAGLFSLHRKRPLDLFRGGVIVPPMQTPTAIMTACRNIATMTRQPGCVTLPRAEGAGFVQADRRNPMGVWQYTVADGAGVPVVDCGTANEARVAITDIRARAVADRAAGLL